MLALLCVYAVVIFNGCKTTRVGTNGSKITIRREYLSAHTDTGPDYVNLVCALQLRLGVYCNDPNCCASGIDWDGSGASIVEKLSKINIILIDSKEGNTEGRLQNCQLIAWALAWSNLDARIDVMPSRCVREEMTARVVLRERTSANTEWTCYGDKAGEWYQRMESALGKRADIGDLSRDEYTYMTSLANRLGLVFLIDPACSSISLGNRMQIEENTTVRGALDTICAKKGMQWELVGGAIYMHLIVAEGIHAHPL